MCCLSLYHIWVFYFILLCISQNHVHEIGDPTPDIILRKENPFILSYQRKDSGSEDEREERIPDLEKDDFAIRRAKLNQPKRTLPFSHYLLGPYTNKEQGKLEEGKKRKMKQERTRCAFLSFIHPESFNWLSETDHILFPVCLQLNLLVCLTVRTCPHWVFLVGFVRIEL